MTFSSSNKIISEVGKWNVEDRTTEILPLEGQLLPSISELSGTLDHLSWLNLIRFYFSLSPPLCVQFLSFPTPCLVHLHLLFSSVLLQGSREWGVRKVSLELWNIFLYPIPPHTHSQICILPMPSLFKSE